MNDSTLGVVFVPGAWMGAWIWEPAVRRLTECGFDAEALTLSGLAPGEPRNAVARVRLADHVSQLQAHVSDAGCPVVLVSHSYSSMVTAQVADRLGETVAGLIHFGGFLPLDGRSLLDDWGSSRAEREQEKADVAAAGHLWMPPDRAMLEYETDLSADDRDFLATRFTPHPGRTITDQALMESPVSKQPTTYVALSPQGAEHAWQRAPNAARDAVTWRRRHIASGHWPMLSQPEQVIEVLTDEIGYYASRSRPGSQETQRPGGANVDK